MRSPTTRQGQAAQSLQEELDEFAFNLVLNQLGRPKKNPKETSPHAITTRLATE
jgi:hypothetical protein